MAADVNIGVRGVLCTLRGIVADFPLCAIDVRERTRLTEYPRDPINFRDAEVGGDGGLEPPFVGVLGIIPSSAKLSYISRWSFFEDNFRILRWHQRNRGRSLVKIKNKSRMTVDQNKRGTMEKPSRSFFNECGSCDEIRSSRSSK
jgi:hypothetical protein